MFAIYARRKLSVLSAFFAIAMPLAACGGAKTPKTKQVNHDSDPEIRRVKEMPPPPGPARNVSLKKPVEIRLKNGLKVLAVANDNLPVVYATLVARGVTCGGPTSGKPGIESLVADMLLEGTTKKDSRTLAEAIEFLGADFWAHADSDSLNLGMRTLANKLPEALGLLGEVVTSPRFAKKDLDKLKKRERDRIKTASSRPRYLSRQAFYRMLFAPHQTAENVSRAVQAKAYGQYDIDPKMLNAARPNDLKRWHKHFLVPDNAYLVVVGQFAVAELEKTLNDAFSKWKNASPTKKAAEKAKPFLPPDNDHDKPRIVIVNRPASVQSEVIMGNLATNAAHSAPFSVVNQVLGGSVASRLFSDLREKRALTYGAYSHALELCMATPVQLTGSTDTPKTASFVSGMLEHITKIRGKMISQDEMTLARNALSNGFVLEIDTPRSVLGLWTESELHKLPENYWSEYRQALLDVDVKGASMSAQTNFSAQPLVIVVGDAASIAGPLEKLGTVEVVDKEGNHITRPKEAEEARK